MNKPLINKLLGEILIKSKPILFVLLMLFLITISCASAADNETIETANNDMTAQEVLSDDNGETLDFTHLNATISKASENEITLKNDYRYDSGNDTMLSEGIVIDKDNLIINGDNHIIDASNTAGIFNIAANNVTLKNINFINAHAGLGAAVFSDVENGKLIIDNCNFTNNQGNRGGAIEINKSSTLIVKNSGFSGNNGFDAGAIYAYDIIVENSRFAKNEADQYGGALHSDYALISDCEFTANYAHQHGGAVHARYSATVENSNFTDNFADSHGGAVYFDGNGSVKSSEFINNTAKGYGGSVYIKNNGDVSDCEFKNNTAGGIGGAVHINAKSVKNSNFTGNIAATGGSGVFFSDEGLIENCRFTDNTCDNNGGAVKFGSNGTVINSIFSNNRAARGGAIHLETGTSIIENSSFTNNTATGDGGNAIFSKKNAIVNWCNFTGNNYGQKGGAIYIDDTGIVKNSIFTNNSARELGGAICMMQSGSVENSIFVNNSVNDIAILIAGGAIFIMENGTVSNSAFIKNSANMGGAIFFIEDGTVRYCNFTENEAEDGGAVYFNGKSTLIYSNFTRNTAENGGGAFFHDGGSISNSIFSLNNADLGGAAYFHNTGTVDKSEFTKNTADNDGGALYIKVSGTVNNSRFTDNAAMTGYGGAIYSNSVNLKNSIFLSNKAKSVSLNYLNNFKFEFKGHETHINAIYAQNPSFDNVTYWRGEMANTDDIAPVMNAFEGVTITVEVYDSGNNLVDNGTITTDAGSQATYNPYRLSDGEYTLKAYHGDDSYYYASNQVTESFSLNRLPSEVKINIHDNAEFTYKKCNITFNSSSEARIMITDKSGNVLLNRTSNEDYVICNLDVGEYSITVYIEGNETYAPARDSRLFRITPLAVAILASSKSYVINYGGKYQVSVKNMENERLSFELNGKTVGYATTNSDGVATFTFSDKILKTAKAGVKNLVIKLMSRNYESPDKSVKITINKEKTKITAKSKKFKRSAKIKKYSITLKNSKGKAIKKMKVYIKIKNKTYKATTNSKGKATFKIKKLTKKGTYKATLTFKGNKYYNKVVKKVKIKIR